MTLAVSAYIGQAAPATLLRTFVCAYCAGVMLTQFLNVPGFGNLIVRHIARKRALSCNI